MAARLLTPRAAAEYLGYRSTAILAQIPVAPVRVCLDGKRHAPRYDVRALDAWLDRLSGLQDRAQDGAGADLGSEVADTEFEAWKARKAARG